MDPIIINVLYYNTIIIFKKKSNCEIKDNESANMSTFLLQQRKKSLKSLHYKYTFEF